MGVVLSNAARNLLATKTPVSIIKKVEVVKELLNADLRVYVDVTNRVLRYGVLTNDSTLKSSTQWAIASLSPSLNNFDNYLSRLGAATLWKTLNIRPEDAWLKFQMFLLLPDGTYETLQIYYGKIRNLVPTRIGENNAVELVTRHATEHMLAANFNKQTSGDEWDVLGSTW